MQNILSRLEFQNKRRLCAKIFGAFAVFILGFPVGDFETAGHRVNQVLLDVAENGGVLGASPIGDVLVFGIVISVTGHQFHLR